MAMSKYKKTAVGFERTDKQPLEANTFFESKTIANTYAASATAYPGQRVYVKENGLYNEYQVESSMLAPMSSLPVMYATDLLNLSESSTIEDFIKCFGLTIKNGRDFYRIFRGVRQFCDTNSLYNDTETHYSATTNFSILFDRPIFGIVARITYVFPEHTIREYTAVVNVDNLFSLSDAIFMLYTIE